MNVAFVTDSFPPIIDGVGRCVLECAKEFVAGGHGKCIVVTPHVPGRDYLQYPFPVFHFSSLPLPNMEYRAGYPYMPSLIKKIGQMGIDIIHAHSPFTAMTISKKLRKKFGVPIIYTQHTKWEYDIASAVGIPVIAKALEKYIYSNINAADDVWAVSQKTGEHIKNRGFSGEFTVMQNGTDFSRADADPALLESLSQKYEIGERAPILLFVGRMMWYKNQMLTLEALETLNKRGFDFRMFFIGDGIDLEDMKKTAREKNLHDKVFFPGRIDDRELLRAYYAKSDLFVFPSTYDNAPLVIREAAACGCPPLVIKNSSASEILDDSKENQTAFFAEETPESVADGIEGAFSDMGRYEFVKKNAADKIYLPWSKVIERSLAKYAEICGNYELRATQKKGGD
ncbi:MAG: glycosyltransferase [Oscillospiraceae bacterium]|nr:glycosyltransferase [Oscillospiraceae bacterium]